MVIAIVIVIVIVPSMACFYRLKTMDQTDDAKSNTAKPEAGFSPLVCVKPEYSLSIKKLNYVPSTIW